uniref:Flavanone 4-reductase n=1 Tax=Tetraselmis sp. GSL018 TaxID=582737 RepID=A0A061R5M2_9CHLO
MVETVLITGATGFIALEIAYQLLKQGKYKVKGTVRNLGNKQRNQPLIDLVPDAKLGPPELVAADLLSPVGWEEAVKDVDYVLHTASPFYQSSKEAELVEPAVQGTLNVLRACSAEGSKVKRVIVTSSCASVAYGHKDFSPDHVYTEADWTNPDNVEAYTKSKTLAEKAAWDFVKTNPGHKFELSTVNPSLVLGRCRTSPGTSVDLVAQMMTGKIPALPDINLGVVDVEDVAKAHVRAMECEVAGERFILSAAVLNFRDIADILAEEFRPRGVRVTTARLPRIVGSLLSLFSPQMRSIMRDWGRRFGIDGSKAERVLGFEYTEPRRSIVATGNMLIEAGVVRTK